MSPGPLGGSPFGALLRNWRRERGVSQLQLAALASTTPRYVSFIETGRSRPGRDVVLRLGSSLSLPVRAQNELMRAAGFAPEFPERALNEDDMRPFKMAIESMLEKHSPFPACAFDALGSLRFANPTFRALWGAVAELSPEDAVDAFFGPGPSRDMLENWAEVAWANADARRSEARRTNDPRVRALYERALAHLSDVPRPPLSENSPVVCLRLRIGGRLIRTFATVMRFEHATEITISELRVELIFPMDEDSAEFFRQTAAALGGDAA